MAEPLLELDHVTKRFGRVVIAEDLSFTVGPGDTVGIVGPNGAGKTSLFGPTIPTVSPGPTVNDRSSAMTTRPNRFVTWSSSSSGSVIRSFVRRLERRGERHLRHQRIVDDLH